MSFPASFISFTLLPAELRLEIWRSSCRPRVVEVIYEPRDDRCITTTSVPAILQVCHESRSEALRLYQKSFSTWGREPRIYFCPEMDTLYLSRPSFLGYSDFSRAFTRLVRHTGDIVYLAIDHVPSSIRLLWEIYSQYVLIHSFPHIHEVFLVIENPDSADADGHAGELDLINPTIDTFAMDKMLDDVKMSFDYEVGRREEKEATAAPLPLPPIVLKWKSWTHC
ncbi:hypothetical protein GGS21DRAFT_239201 [Xylaria nigripes]|nr:hypothetical protein GGS21DRAFT_239201 [Xylaria nigripes]